MPVMMAVMPMHPSLRWHVVAWALVLHSGCVLAGAPLVLPGITALGAGFDVVCGAASQGSVFALTYNQGNTVRIPQSPFGPGSWTIYAIPDHVSVTMTAPSLAAQSTVVYSPQQAASLLTANVAPVGALLPSNGPFAQSTLVHTTSASLQHPNSYSAVAVTQSTSAMYQATMGWQAQILDPSFVADVRNLPGLYDPELYLRFTQKYGTHVLMSGSFGGQATVIASVNSAQGRSKSSGEIAQQALLYFQYVAAGNSGPRPAAWFLGDSSGPSIFQSSFLGGRASLPLTSFTTWLQSFVYLYNSTLVANSTNLLNLVPIHQVISAMMPSTFPSVPRNLNTSLAAYYASNPYPPAPLCSAELICPAGQHDACCPITATCCPRGCVATSATGIQPTDSTPGLRLAAATTSGRITGTFDACAAHHHSLSGGAIAGIVIGSIVGVLLLLFTCAFVKNLITDED